MSRSIIVLPDDTSKPILDAIAQATKIHPRQDVHLLRPRAPRCRHRRAASWRRRAHHAQPRAARRRERECRYPQEAHRRWRPRHATAIPIFDVTHEKSMVIDDAIAFVQSLNWETKNVTETRDYAIVTTPQARGRRGCALLRRRLGPQEVRRWRQTRISSGASATDASASASSSTRASTLSGSRTSATRTPPSSSTSSAPTPAASRSTSWPGLRTSSRRKSSSKASAGCAASRTSAFKIHKLRHIKLHAKLILADDSHAIIGSINLAPGSFDSRRELAIQVDDAHIVHRIKKTLEHDWANSHPLDLSDEGAPGRTRGLRPHCERGPCHFNKRPSQKRKAQPRRKASRGRQASYGRKASGKQVSFCSLPIPYENLSASSICSVGRSLRSGSNTSLRRCRQIWPVGTIWIAAGVLG